MNVTQSMTSGTYTYESPTPEEHPDHLAFGLFVFVIAGVCGNSLVCLAILTDKSLQNVTNYFLCSLAIADLLVSTLVMPISVLSLVNQGRWIYSLYLCNAYISLDVLLCSASIVHLSVISLDRYWGISRPLRSRRKSKTTVGIKILIVWLITFLVTLPITSLAFVDSTNVFRDDICQIYNRYFKIYGSVVTFIIPCSIMVITYVRTVTLLTRKMRQSYVPDKDVAGPTAADSPLVEIRLRRSTTAKQNRCIENTPLNPFANSSLPQHSNMVAPSIPKQPTTDIMFATLHEQDHNITHRPCLLSQKQPGVHFCIPCDDGQEHIKSDNCYNDVDHQRIMVRDCATVPLSKTTGYPLAIRTAKRGQMVKMRKAVSLLQLTKRTHMGSASIANEQKASKVLGVVFFCFIFCWAPFFLTNIALAICQDYCINRFPDVLGTVFLWLGYLSSIINPLIYTIFNRLFRQAFSRILKCQLSLRRNRRWITRDIASLRSSVSRATTMTKSSQKEPCASEEDRKMKIDVMNNNSVHLEP